MVREYRWRGNLRAPANDLHRHLDAFDVHAADLDDDGDFDILAASELGDSVVWYENLSVADPLDADTDDDGLLDGDEVDLHGTDPMDADSDEDGFSDGVEIAAGTDPLDPGSFPGPPGVPLLPP